MSDSEYDTYYHYTDHNSAMAIYQSGHIKESKMKHGDAVHGDGTYVTKMDPNHTKEELGWNNWDGRDKSYMSKVREGKLDAAIAVKVRKDDPRMEKHSRDGRDIHKYQGNLPAPKDKSAYIDLKNKK